MTSETDMMGTFYAKKVAGVKSSLYEHNTPVRACPAASYARNTNSCSVNIHIQEHAIDTRKHVVTKHTYMYTYTAPWLALPGTRTSRMGRSFQSSRDYTPAYSSNGGSSLA